jgi:hypothetical protein
MNAGPGRYHPPLRSRVIDILGRKDKIVPRQL